MRDALTARSVAAVGAARLRPAPPARSQLLVRTDRAVRHRRGHDPHRAVPHGRRRRGRGRRRLATPSPATGCSPARPARAPAGPAAPGRGGTAAGARPSSSPTGAGRPPSGPRCGSALAGARLAELREGVWLRPDNLDVRRRGRPTPELRWSTPSARRRRPPPLAAELWDLAGWAAERRATCGPRWPTLRARPRGGRPRRAGATASCSRPPCCATSRPTRCCRRELLPAGWPGADLRRDYDRYDRAYRAVWTDWFRRQR